jgi:hypothetical protein
MPPDKITYHRRNMAGQDNKIAELTRPAKRIKLGNSMAHPSLSETIAISNPYISSKSPSDQIKVTIFERELSIRLNSMDFRFKLPITTRPDDPERSMRIIFHHPLLPSTQHEFYSRRTLQAAKPSEIQIFEKWTKRPLEKPPIDEETPSENGCLDVLNDVRTTLEERNFLCNMLRTSWLRENDEELGFQNDQDYNAGSTPSDYEYNPFILGCRDPDEGNFLAF